MDDDNAVKLRERTGLARRRVKGLGFRLQALAFSGFLYFESKP